jgi:hypothetical protein
VTADGTSVGGVSATFLRERVVFFAGAASSFFSSATAFAAFGFEALGCAPGLGAFAGLVFSTGTSAFGFEVLPDFGFFAATASWSVATDFVFNSAALGAVALALGAFVGF